MSSCVAAFVSTAWSWEFLPLQVGLVNFSSPASTGLIQLEFHADFIVPLCRSWKEGETSSQIKVKVVRYYCFIRAGWVCSVSECGRAALMFCCGLSCRIAGFCESSSHGLQLHCCSQDLHTSWSKSSGLIWWRFLSACESWSGVVVRLRMQTMGSSCCNLCYRSTELSRGFLKVKAGGG